METATAERWLLETLRADATIGEQVYRGEAPPDAVEPYTIIDLYNAGDVTSINGVRIFSNLSYTVKAISQIEPGSLTPSGLEAIADAIDGRLHRATGTITGGEVIASVRDFPISYNEIDEGVVYQHLGGVYLLSVQDQPEGD